MGAMQTNVFAGQAKPPSEKALASALGASFSLWKRLVAELKRELELDTAEWHTPSVKLGWSLRLQRKKRNIVYLGPREGYFLASFALGDKAVAVSRNSALPPSALKIISEAKRYAEGTAVRIEVKNADDLDSVKILARVKAEN